MSSSQIKRLEGLLKKLEMAKEKLEQASKGGFLGLRKGGDFSGAHGGYLSGGDFSGAHGGYLSGGKRRGRPRKSGGAFMGSLADHRGDTVRQHPIYGGYLSGGDFSGAHGGYLSGGRKKKVEVMEEVEEEMDGGRRTVRRKQSIRRVASKGRKSAPAPRQSDMDIYANEELAPVGAAFGGRMGGRAAGGRAAGGRCKGAGSKRSAASNPWIRHVKAWAAKHKVPYQVALGDPKMKAAYRK